MQILRLEDEVTFLTMNLTQLCRRKTLRSAMFAGVCLALLLLSDSLLVGQQDEAPEPEYPEPESRQAAVDRIQRECLRSYPPALLARMASGATEIPEEVDANPESQMRFLDTELPLDKGLFYPILLEDMLPVFERYVSPGVRFLDLGSGDGRVVFMANLLGADAVGIEYDKQMVKISRRAGKALRDLIEPKRARIVRGDFFDSPWSGYDVIFFFDLGSFEPRRVRQKLLAEMDPGAILLVGFEQTPFQGLEVVEQDRPYRPSIKVYRQRSSVSPEAASARPTRRLPGSS
jgi:SAM-dependent methyltransferase